MEPRKVEHPSVAERRARGKVARETAPLSAHLKWKPTADRPDPSACLRSRTRGESLTWCRYTTGA